MSEPRVGQVWERNQSLRLVQENNVGIEPGKLQVVYMLYRQYKIWSQDPKKRRVEWRQYRQGYCSLKTWLRWARKASLVSIKGKLS